MATNAPQHAADHYGRSEALGRAQQVR